MTNQNTTVEVKNDLIELTNERIDSLAALITVTAEQMEDRLRAEELLGRSENRTDELMSLVFGGDSPSVENYLATRGGNLAAA